MSCKIMEWSIMVIKKFEDLEIYKLSFQLAMKIHHLSLEFPKYELYEKGSQIRRSSKSIVTNIVEGFGRKRYKNDFIKYLTYAQASCYETKVHLNFVFNSRHITKNIFQKYINEYDDLGRKIYNFMNNL